MLRVRAVVSVGLAVRLLGTLVSLALAAAPASAATGRSPLVLHLRWRQLTANTTGGDAIATSDRYVAVRGCPGPASSCTPQLWVVDEQTGHRQALAVPSRPVEAASESSRSNCDSWFTPTGFGGPYLAVGCTGDAHWLYNLNTRQWVPVTPRCPADCGFVGVGRYWLKFDHPNPGATCPEHCRNSYFLQNLHTGQVEPDPAKPGGRTFDDLNSPSGAVPLCAPLRYPVSPGGLGSEPGSLRFSGPFALAFGSVNRLERCGSRRVLSVANSSSHFPPLISSRAVVSLGLRRDHCKRRPFGLACTNDYYVRGVYLHGLRQFTASLPSVKAPNNVVPGEVVGLTRRHIYVQATTISRSGDGYPGPLWAATLPQPPRPRRH